MAFVVRRRPSLLGHDVEWLPANLAVDVEFDRIAMRVRALLLRDQMTRHRLAIVAAAALERIPRMCQQNHRKQQPHRLAPNFTAPTPPPRTPDTHTLNHPHPHPPPHQLHLPTPPLPLQSQNPPATQKLNLPHTQPRYLP